METVPQKKISLGILGSSQGRGSILLLLYQNLEVRIKYFSVTLCLAFEQKIAFKIKKAFLLSPLKLKENEAA